MFSKKPKKAKIKFINLAEHLAHQNQIVSKTMDSMLQHVVQYGDAAERSDWFQIQKTSEQFSGNESTAVAPIIPQPKATKRASQKSTTRIGS